MKAFTGAFSRLVTGRPSASEPPSGGSPGGDADEPASAPAARTGPAYFALPESSLLEVTDAKLRLQFLSIFDRVTEGKFEPDALLEFCVGSAVPRPAPAAPPRRVCSLLTLLVVGFHHNHGPVVELVLPGESEAAEDFEEAKPWLSFLCLPDASHKHETDAVSFVLDVKNHGGTRLYGVSCLRRIPAAALEFREPGVTRSCVQKAVCLLSGVPLFGRLDSRLHAVTKAFFEQRDFRNTETLRSFLEEARECLPVAAAGGEAALALNLEWQLPPLLSLLRPKDVLVLVKAMLLEARILVHARSARRTSSAVLVAMSLVPGLFPGSGSPPSHNNFVPYSSSDCLAYPYISLQLVDTVRRARAYLLGVTNPLLLECCEADVVLHVDRGQLEICNKALAPALTLTDAEQRFVRKALRTQPPTPLAEFASPEKEPRGTTGKWAGWWSGGKRLDEGGSAVSAGRIKSFSVITPPTRKATQALLSKLPRGFCPFNLDDDCVHTPAVARGTQDADVEEEAGEEDEMDEMDEMDEEEGHSACAGEQSRAKSVVLADTKVAPQHEEEDEEDEEDEDESANSTPSSDVGRASYEEEAVSAVSAVARGVSGEFGDFGGQIRAQVADYVRTLLRLVAYACGPRRSLAEFRQAVEERSLGLRAFQNEFLLVLAGVPALEDWVRRHKLPTIPRFESPPRCGWASFEYENGDAYLGEFSRGLRHGIGCYVGRGGMVYAGGWALDKRNGEGAMAVRSTGTLYEGAWRKDQHNGHGAMLSRKEFYVGQWRGNKYEGRGRFADFQGNRFFGTFAAGRLHGNGVLHRSNGEVSAGSWVNAKLSGVGRRIFRDGRVYVGRFQLNHPDGDGIMLFPDGTCFEGEWRAGLRSGRGSLFVPSRAFLAAYESFTFAGSGSGYPAGSTADEDLAVGRAIRQAWRSAERDAYIVQNATLTGGRQLPDLIVEGVWEDDLPQCDEATQWVVHFPTGEKFEGTLSIAAPLPESPPPVLLPPQPAAAALETAVVDAVGATALWARLKTELRSRRLREPTRELEEEEETEQVQQVHGLVLSAPIGREPPIAGAVTGKPREPCRVIPEGKGVEYLSSGVYEGAFREGMRFGHGEFCAYDGTRYRGDWAFGLEHGAGTRVSSDGKATIGYFTAGELKITTAQLQAMALATPDLTECAEISLPEKPSPFELEATPELWRASAAFQQWPLEATPYFGDSRVPDYARYLRPRSDSSSEVM